MVAHTTTRCEATNAACSSALIAIWARRLTWRRLRSARDELGRSARALRRGTNRRPGVLGLEHDRVACLLEDFAHEPIDAGEPELDDYRAVVEIGDHGPLLARPARA